MFYHYCPKKKSFSCSICSIIYDRSIYYWDLYIYDDCYSGCRSQANLPPPVRCIPPSVHLMSTICMWKPQGNLCTWHRAPKCPPWPQTQIDRDCSILENMDGSTSASRGSLQSYRFCLVYIEYKVSRKIWTAFTQENMGFGPASCQRRIYEQFCLMRLR